MDHEPWDFHLSIGEHGSSDAQDGVKWCVCRILAWGYYQEPFSDTHQERILEGI